MSECDNVYYSFSNIYIYIYIYIYMRENLIHIICIH